MIDFELTFKNAYERAVASHLKEVCKADSSFAELCKKDHNSMEGCMLHITHKAKEQAVDGCAVIPDEEVYAWAEEYIKRDFKKQEIKMPEGKVATPTLEVKKDDSNFQFELF